MTVENITYDEFIDMQFDYLLKQYTNVIKIERLQGVNNIQVNQFILYFKKDVPEKIMIISPNGESSDTTFRLIKTWNKNEDRQDQR